MYVYVSRYVSIIQPSSLEVMNIHKSITILTMQLPFSLVNENSIFQWEYPNMVWILHFSRDYLFFGYMNE